MLEIGEIKMKKGFTLIELLVVVLIIGILTAIAVPKYQMAIAKSRLANIKYVFASIRQAQESYYTAHGEYANNIEDLDIDLSYCKRSSDYSNVLICDDNFMIDILDAAKLGLLRAAYCPGEIKGAKRWDTCAYSVGDYVYNMNYTTPYSWCSYQKTDLGNKICASL